jgi:hypothetical protein
MKILGKRARRQKKAGKKEPNMNSGEMTQIRRAIDAAHERLIGKSTYIDKQNKCT